MTQRAWPVQPGVPAAGHVTARGYWHPGKIDGCRKCYVPSAAAKRTAKALREWAETGHVPDESHS